jgi:hypothetical protein
MSPVEKLFELPHANPITGRVVGKALTASVPAMPVEDDADVIWNQPMMKLPFETAFIESI